MNQQTKKNLLFAGADRFQYLIIAFLAFNSPVVMAKDTPKVPVKTKLSQQVKSLFSSGDKTPSNQINTAQISDFDADIKNVDVLPTIYVQSTATPQDTTVPVGRELSIYDAIKIAVNRHPSISAAISALGQENTNVDIAKSSYWPQVQAGVTTGRLGTGEGKQQMFTVNADQTLYDFGKTKNNVRVYQSGVDKQKANILNAVDDVAMQTADAFVNVAKYQSIVKINQAQVQGISRILNIARLRANAGLTSQADPIQAQSRYESSQSTLLDSQMSLRQWEERLRSLTGIPSPYRLAPLPDNLIRQAKLYENPAPNQLPAVIAAEYEKNAAQAQKDLARSNRLPTLSVEGSVNQALNGKNPYNDKQDGAYGSVMLKVTGPTWQGGSLSGKERAANYAIEAARAKRDAAYVQVSDKIRDYREQILGTQERLTVLANREQSIIKTRELYEDQYKLGTRTVLDLLNAEQEIQFAASERENARFDTWQNLVNYIAVTGRSRDVYSLNNTKIQGVEINP